MQENNLKSFMKKYIKPVILELLELYGRGNNTCASSGQGIANTCNHVGSGT